jgi:hypothetical protein
MIGVRYSAHLNNQIAQRPKIHRTLTGLASGLALAVKACEAGRGLQVHGASQARPSRLGVRGDVPHDRGCVGAFGVQVGVGVVFGGAPEVVLRVPEHRPLLVLA